MAWSPNNQQGSSDTAFQFVAQGVLTIGATAVPCTVDQATFVPLQFRKLITLQAEDNDIFYGLSDAVTTSTGIKLPRNGIVFLPYGPGILVHLIAGGASRTLRLHEAG